MNKTGHCHHHRLRHKDLLLSHHRHLHQHRSHVVVHPQAQLGEPAHLPCLTYPIQAGTHHQQQDRLKKWMTTTHLGRRQDLQVMEHGSTALNQLPQRNLDNVKTTGPGIRLRYFCLILSSLWAFMLLCVMSMSRLMFFFSPYCCQCRRCFVFCNENSMSFPSHYYQ